MIIMILDLYSAHISLKQRLKALYNITPTDLVKPLHNSTSWEAYKKGCHWRSSLGMQHSLAVHVPGTHFKYCWVDRGNRSQMPFPRVKRTSWGMGRTADLSIESRTP